MKKTEMIIILAALIITLIYGAARFLRFDFASETLLLSHLSVSFLAGYYLINKKKSFSYFVIISFLVYPIGFVFRMFHFPLSSISFVEAIAMLGSSYLIFTNRNQMKEKNQFTNFCFTLIGILSLCFVLVPFASKSTFNLLQIVWLLIFLTSLFFLQFTSNSKNEGDTIPIIKLLLVSSFLPTTILITNSI